MKRRLYFLLPDVMHTRSIVAELETEGIERRCIHVIAAPDIDLEDLPAATARQRNDLDAKLEFLFWNGNLVLFTVALLALPVLALLHASWYWLLIPAAVALATLASGIVFTRHIPNVHLSEFTDAINHHEILLIVDVPVKQVAHVEALVHRHHPEAVTGGVGWHVDIDALHV